MDLSTDIGDEPLELGFTPKSLVELPPEMIRAIAMGMEDPGEIAARYGFTGAKWEKLQKWEPFLLTIAHHKAELEKSGVTFRLKSAWKADQLSDQVFLAAMASDTSLAQKMAVLQYMAKMGELEPAEKKVANAGEGFSISINIAGRSMTLKGAQSDPAPTPPVQMVEDVQEIIRAPSFAPLVDPEFLRELQENNS